MIKDNFKTIIWNSPLTILYIKYIVFSFVNVTFIEYLHKVQDMSRSCPFSLIQNLELTLNLVCYYYLSDNLSFKGIFRRN